MPITASSRPASAASLITVSSSGISDSPPSRENRRWPTYLFCRNVSNASATFSLDRIRICSSWLARVGGTSICAWIHLRSSGSWMCMYSMPTVRQ